VNLKEGRLRLALLLGAVGAIGVLLAHIAICNPRSSAARTPRLLDDRGRCQPRLEGFAFSASGGTPAFACWSRLRTITRTHSGSADRPMRKSS